jgi:hypothetical protein
MSVFMDVPVFAHASVRVFGTHESACENILALVERLHAAGARSCALVFDGTPVALKAEELARRRAAELASQAPPLSESALPSESAVLDSGRLSASAAVGMGAGMMITDLDECALFAPRLLKPNSETFAAIRAAAEQSPHFQTGFLSILHAPADAEACCAKEAAACDGVVLTSDSDALTFGAPRVLRYLPGTPGFTLVSLQGVLDSLGLTFSAFQQWCVMCGSDFCAPIKQVGPMTALKYLRAAQAVAQTAAQTSAQAAAQHGDDTDLISCVLAHRRRLLDAHFLCESALAFEARYAQALAVFRHT